MISEARRIFSVLNHHTNELIQPKYHQTNVQHGIQKSNMQHSNQNSLFTFEEPQLDAESFLENIRDTNIRSFLHRF